MIQTNRSSILPALLWIAAFICALYPVNQWQLTLSAGSIVLLFAWAFFMLTQDFNKGWSVPRSPVLGMAAGFLSLLLTSIFWSEVKPASVMGFCIIGMLPLTFLAGAVCGRQDYFKIVAASLGIIFAALSTWAIIQFFFLNTYFGGQARHPLADPSSLGTLLSLGLFGALGWLFVSRTKMQSSLATTLCALLLCGIFATVSRAPIFAFIPPFVILCVLQWQQIKQKKYFLLAVTLAAVAYLGAAQMNNDTRFELGKRIAETVRTDIKSIPNHRPHIWRSTLEMIKQRPLLGTGVGTYALYYPEFRSYEVYDTTYLAHNDPLQFWAELGILGPVLFYGFCIAGFMRTARALKTPDITPQDRTVIASLFCGLGALVIASHVGFPLFNPSILLMTGFMLSVWFVVSGRVLKESVQPCTLKDVPPAVGKVLIALPFLMIAWLMLGIVAGEYFATRASKNLFSGNMMCLTPEQEQTKDCFQENINRAARVSMDLNARAYLFAVNVPMSILKMNQWDSQKTEEQKALYLQISDYMRRVLEINPRNASAHYYLGKVQTLVTKSAIPEGAASEEEEYKIALRLDPTHLGARMALYELYKREKRSVREQLDVLSPVENFIFNTTEAQTYYSELAKLYLEDKNYVKATMILKKAAAFEKRSDFSKRWINSSIMQNLVDGESALEPSP
jgi:O-antigen ligase